MNAATIAELFVLEHSHYRLEVGLMQHIARADIAIVRDGDVHLVEIKARTDTLKRLPHQVNIYSLVGASCTLIVDRRHSQAALGIIPDWWGLCTAVDGAVCEDRRAQPNPAREWGCVTAQLWREDMVRLLHQADALKGYASAPRAKLIPHVLANVSHALILEAWCVRI